MVNRELMDGFDLQIFQNEKEHLLEVRIYNDRLFWTDAATVDSNGYMPHLKAEYRINYGAGGHKPDASDLECARGKAQALLIACEIVEALGPTHDPKRVILYADYNGIPYTIV